MTASGLTPLAAATVNVAAPAAVGVPERTPVVVFRQPGRQGTGGDTEGRGRVTASGERVRVRSSDRGRRRGRGRREHRGRLGGVDGDRRTGVTASGLTPLAAAAVNVAAPAAVGVPERTPVVVFRLSPAGRAPEATLKVGAGSPLAANVYVYAAPTVAVAGGVDAVNTGAAGAAGAGRISIKDRFHLSVVGAVSKILTERAPSLCRAQFRVVSRMCHWRWKGTHRPWFDHFRQLGVALLQSFPTPQTQVRCGLSREVLGAPVGPLAPPTAPWWQCPRQ